MPDTPANRFSRQCELLADLWLNHKENELLEEFIEYNDIGLPLAYAFAKELAKPTELSTKYISETYNSLLEALGLSDSDEWEDIDDMLYDSPKYESGFDR